MTDPAAGRARLRRAAGFGEDPRRRRVDMFATLGGVASQWPLTARSSSIEQLGRMFTGELHGGVVLTGPAGVGKTRLGEELLTMAGSRPTARAVGHAATQSIPLGALAHLLPPELARDIGLGDDDRAALFHRARLAVAQRAGDERLILLVDDVDQLDDTSLALLLPLTLQRTVFVIATLRSGRAMPPVVSTLVKDGHVTIDEVAPLGRDDIVTLLHRVLDGPIETTSAERLAEVSDGNLQVLQEVVRLASSRDVLRLEHGAWRLTELPIPRALEELVQSRIDGLDTAERGALDLLSVAGTLTLDDLVELAGADVVDRLEAQHTVRITSDAGTPVVTHSHPIYGEVLRSQLDARNERSIKARLADRFEHRRAAAPEDLSRLAAWRLDSGGDVSPGVLLAAGRLALVGRDRASAARFAKAAAERGAVHDASRIAVEAALLQFDVAAAELEAQSVWDDPSLPDGHRAHLAHRLAMARFGLGDIAAALALTEDAARRVTEPDAVASVHAQHAHLLATTGRPGESLRVLGDGGDDGYDGRVRIARCAARSTACAALGRFDEAIAAAQRGAEAQSELPEWLARRGMATHLVNEAHAYAYSGRFETARRLVEPALDAAIDAGATAAQHWFHLVLGETWRDSGNGRRALEHFRAAVALAGPGQQGASLVWSWVGVAQSHLLLGEAEPAAAALTEADAAGDSPLATSWATRERTRAWLTACRGDLTAARERIAEIAGVMRADGIPVFELVLLHDLARFGDPAAVADRVVELAATIEGPWATAMADHVTALTGHDADLLTSVVDQFETIGSLAFAAEAAAELAELLHRRSDARGATAAERRCRGLIERAGGARTPGLLRGAAPVPLSQREHEVALLAASGLTSHEIAARLVLSTRTVDTHLARVYRKLGISGREHLDAALAIDSDRSAAHAGT